MKEFFVIRQVFVIVEVFCLASVGGRFIYFSWGQIKQRPFLLRAYCGGDKLAASNVFRIVDFTGLKAGTCSKLDRVLITSRPLRRKLGGLIICLAQIYYLLCASLCT